MLRNSRYTRFIRQGNCPTRVAIGAVSNVAPSVFNVPHGSITSDGTACTSASAMTVVTSSSGAAGDLDALLAADDILDATFEALNPAGASFLVGFESQRRVCGRGGAATQPAPAVTLVINEDAGLAIPSVAFLRPTPGGYIVVFTPSAGQRIPCTYAAARQGVAAHTGVVDDEAGGGWPRPVRPRGGVAGGGAVRGRMTTKTMRRTRRASRRRRARGGPAAQAAVAVPAVVLAASEVPAVLVVPAVPAVPVRVAPVAARVAARAAAALGRRRTTMTMTIRRPLWLPAAVRAAAARVAAAPVAAARAPAVRVCLRAL
ncbi:hypothetical protein BU14_0399s0001 [Porphyra umbilicalis]|uniref:Uncharacterized protein n=1 Tax=Porphyra umbilicalis TaxID=2786 RepID=A0A1X6NWH5_PORUM|nr:hypothetical protein BU14_0399s0001 [Porphyra umbilicalis]|eukprot:OSX72856.1 hypothetical protein BU14_0399s0001 [Porphyra umbilicalis]